MLTRDLAAWVAGVNYESIPPSVIDRTKLLLADILAIMVRARNESESTPPLIAALEDLGLAAGNFHVIGSNEQYSAAGAVRLNATNAHSIELDDTYSPRGLHTTCAVVPAALAAAEMVQARGREVLAGIVAGVETMCRVALGLGGRSQRGFHATPVCGGFGAAAAAARILGLSAEQVEHSFGIVLSETAGNMQFHANGAWTKRSQIGHASSSGLTAAALARRGYTGPAEALEGNCGFFRLYADSPSPELVLKDLGVDWQIMQIAFKPHAACRGTHAAIDAALAIRHEDRTSFDDVDCVDIGLPRQPLDLIALLAEPEQRKREPLTTVDGQFSIYFCVAVALRLGRLAWDDYATQLFDPAIRSLIDRTRVYHDERAVQQRNGSAAGSVRVTMRNRDVLERVVNLPKGEPENMLTTTELRTKFDSLVLPYLGADGGAELFDNVLRLEAAPSIDVLFNSAARCVQ